MPSITSKNGIPIRLPNERWEHVIEEHAELSGLREDVLETVANPEFIFAGGAGELLATREIEPHKWIVVVYRESQTDGYVITSFLTRRFASLERRRRVWQSEM
jgi:hypothetical protein